MYFIYIITISNKKSLIYNILFIKNIIIFFIDN